VEPSGELLGQSDAMKYLHFRIRQVAPSDTTVLILGETGTGKELVAEAIHALGPRKGRALVKVNCAALPPTLAESELFGHEKGAFTGSMAQRKGRFELADGATLFLDEVGELMPELQAKLLRVLQDGTFERVGGDRTRKVDVRVIAATNRDLEAEVRAGRFRPDLYYRLLVVPLTLPPLRARAADIPLLAARFLAVACRKNRVRARILNPTAVEALLRHSWPGNVRELRNAMERAAILASGETIDRPDLAFLAPGAERPIEPAGLAAEMERHERAVVLLALERNGWKMTQTAAALGLERSHLYKKLKALGIERPAED
jgi:transcriptional regulator with GAF, ATPase, and Fis domain